MSDTETAQTIYGDVDFETNTCASCGQRYLPEDTETLHYGTVQRVAAYSHKTKVDFDPMSHGEMHICDNCKDQPTQITFPNVATGFLFGFGAGLCVLFLLALIF